MNISYDFQLGAAEHGHRYTGFTNRGGEITPACACGWKGEPEEASVRSDPMITWARHVLDKVTDRMITPEAHIRLKGGQEV